jgi:hypothetical protein
MMSINRKWWLALVALLCLAPTTFAVQDEAKPKTQRIAQASSGGWLFSGLPPWSRDHMPVPRRQA